MQGPSSAASDAHAYDQASQNAYAPEVPAHAEAGQAPQATHDLLLEALKYTLTVGQAQQRFSELKRHVPKGRTMQNYCQRGDIAAQKIRTTFGSEWIIDAQSLDAFILGQPEVPSVASDAFVTEA